MTEITYTLTKDGWSLSNENALVTGYLETQTPPGDGVTILRSIGSTVPAYTYTYNIPGINDYVSLTVVSCVCCKNPDYSERYDCLTSNLVPVNTAGWSNFNYVVTLQLKSGSTWNTVDYAFGFEDDSGHMASSTWAATKGELSHNATGEYRIQCILGPVKYSDGSSCQNNYFGFVLESYDVVPSGFTISFNGNGNTSGTPPSSITSSEYTRNVTMPGKNTLAKNGSKFAGWNTKADGSGTSYQEGESYSVSGEFVLYAEWEQALTITYTDTGADGGSPPVDTNTYIEDDVFYTQGNTGGLYKNGHTLSGWYYSVTGEEFGVNSGPYTYWYAFGITLQPRWAASKYTITYNGNGNTSGTPPSDDRQYERGDSFITKSNTDLVKTGYAFAGWNTNKNGAGTHYTPGVAYQYPIEGDLTLYAEWVQGSGAYTITYSANGGSNPPTDSNKYNYNDRFTPPSGLGMTPPSVTPVFDGWWPNLQGAGMPQCWPLSPTRFTYNDNKTFYAKWSSSGRAITYLSGDADSGTPPVDNTLYSVSEHVSFIPAYNSGNLYRNGYTFGGWRSNIGLEFTPGEEAILRSNETTFTPIWNKRVTLTYDGNGNTSGSTPPTQTGASGDVLQVYGNIGGLARDGATFNGWNTASDGSGTSYTPGSSTITLGSSDITLYAQWSGTLYNVAVTQPEHGTISPQSNSYMYGDVVNFIASPDSGYVFDSWSHTGNGYWSENGNTAALTVRGQETVTCTFVEDVSNRCLIEIDRYGAVSPDSRTYIVNRGTTATVQLTYQVGHTFWKVETISGECTVSPLLGGSSLSVTPQSNCIIRTYARPFLVTPIAQPNQIHKYRVIISNQDGMMLLTRNVSNSKWISDINFSSVLDGVGSGSFVIHTLSSIGDGTTVDIGSDVIILENNFPVYYGYVTNIRRNENNFYGDHSFGGIQEYTVDFSEASRELNSQPSNNLGLYNSSPGAIAYRILGGQYCGDIDTTTSTLSYDITRQNKLSLLDKLGDQSGWRYRCRPYIISASSGATGVFPSSGSTGTLTCYGSMSFHNLRAGDIIIVSTSTSVHAYKSIDDSGETHGISTVRFNQAVHSDNQGVSTCDVYHMRRYVLDFKPSFYQDESVVISDDTIPSDVDVNNAWGTNYTALNNNDSTTQSIKYGSVSVSSPQGNGVTYTSTIPLTQVHNEDYTYSNSTYIKSSLDSTITSYLWDKDSNVLDLTVQGGSASDIIDVLNASQPVLYMTCVYYPNSSLKGDRGLYVNVPIHTSNSDINFTTEVGVLPITSDYPYKNTWIRIYVVANSTLYEELTNGSITPINLSGTRYYVTNGRMLTGGSSEPTDEPIVLELGGEECSCYVIPISGYLYVDSRNYSGESYEPIPTHREGALVMVGSKDSPEPGSPYSEYPERTLCAEMQSGYPFIDVDYIASNYALFGSNFDTHGSCKVPLVKFAKIDSQIYNTSGMLNVGDHIAIYKSYTSASNASKDYELLEYKVDLDKMMVDVKYGTKTIDLGSTLYNLRKNISTNITRF